MPCGAATSDKAVCRSFASSHSQCKGPDRPHVELSGLPIDSLGNYSRAAHAQRLPGQDRVPGAGTHDGPQKTVCRQSPVEPYALIRLVRMCGGAPHERPTQTQSGMRNRGTILRLLSVAIDCAGRRRLIASLAGSLDLGVRLRESNASCSPGTARRHRPAAAAIPGWAPSVRRSPPP
jgi:hypothetical protein